MTSIAAQGRLAGRTALVTGAGSSGPGWGVGKAITVACARDGAKVACLDVKRANAQETARIIEDEGGTALALAADVTDNRQVEGALRQVLDTWGRLDVLVNNVGILELGGPVEASVESWDRVMDVNLKSMFLTCKHAIPAMQAQGRGAIVNIASIAATHWTGIPYISYASSKAGAVQFTRQVALQHAREGIRANVILPGLLDTPMVREPLKDHYADGDVEEMIAKRDAMCPTGKMGDAWDIAHAAVFLASDEAKYITGTDLVVDGGITAKFA